LTVQGSRHRLMERSPAWVLREPWSLA
jgi:hypothetical protein